VEQILWTVDIHLEARFSLLNTTKTKGIATANMFSEAKFYAHSAGAISFSIKIIYFSGKHKK
jgi:hypothetical protein